MTINPKYLHSDISNSILQAFYTVRRLLPFNLTNDVYKRALAIEMKSMDLVVDCDKEFKIKYKNKIVGSFFIDFIVNDSIIIKVIQDDATCDHVEADAKNQLRLTDFEVCLILNFSAEPNQQHSRIVLTNDLKKKNISD
jgi:GxxExxY protein